MTSRLYLLAASVMLGAAASLLIATPTAAAAVGAAAVCVCMLLRRTLWLLVAALAAGWLLGSTRIAQVEVPLPDGTLGETLALVQRPPSSVGDAVVATVQVADGPLRGHRATLWIRDPPWVGDAGDLLLDIGDVISIRDMEVSVPSSSDLRDRVRRLRTGAVGIAYVSHTDLERRGEGGGPLTSIARMGREWMRSAAGVLPASAGALMLGITIGDTSELSSAMQEDFRRTGLTHLVAVSGANVAIVLGGVLLLLRALRAPVGAIPWLLIAVAAAFCAVSAFEPSVIRATAMATLVLVASSIGAARRSLHLLAVALLVLSLWDPFLFLETGFQLSVLATAGLLTVSRRLIARGDGPVLVAVAATLGAQVTTAPLLASVTDRISLVSLPANLIAAPFVAPATIFGFASGALGGIVPPLRYLAWIAYPFLELMQLFARILADLPFAVADVPAGVGGVAVVAILVGIAWLALRRGRRAAATVAALSLAVPALLGVAAELGQPPALVGLNVTMLDVGQGESILIREGEHTMLIDGGPRDDEVPRMLRDAGIHRLDYVVVSHAHDDHIAGLVPILERVAVGAVLDPGLEAPIEAYAEIRDAVARRQIPFIEARSGQTYPLGRATVRILWPTETLMTGTDSDLNENSIVLRVDLGSDSFLYSGETQELAQRALLEASPSDLRADVLKVSHHGSARMEPEFYRETGATLALIPVGDNPYGHPAPLTLMALEGMSIYRSDLHGHVSVTVDGSDRLVIRTGAQASP